MPIDNHAAENALRPRAVGRENWLFIVPLGAGERAAVLMSLIEAAKPTVPDPWASLTKVFERLPTLKSRALAQRLPPNWRLAGGTADPGLVAEAATA